MSLTQTIISDQVIIENDSILSCKVIKNADTQAFEILFKNHYARLTSLAYGFMKSYVQAEEVVSDVFFKFWKNRSSIQVNSSLSSYLNMAVKNRCLDLLRVTKKTTDADPEPYLNVSPSGLASPEEQIVSNELQNRIERAIEKLPEDRKRVFRLSRDNGLKYREIADLLNISIKTVETQMGRSLKHLRSELKDYLSV